MSFFDYFRGSKPPSASIAKERLQIIVAHERGLRQSQFAFLPEMEKELLAVVRKYVPIDDEQIKVAIDQDGDCEVLELNISLVEGRDGS